MTETTGSEDISTKIQWIAELARRHPDGVLTTLAHHIDVDFLREAYRRTRKDAAAGVDGRTAKQYAENLDENLEQLLEAFKSGTYYAPPVRRTYIPKGDGRKRPIGIPTFEDKVLQRAVTMVLEAVYEQDFKDCSHGFRPGRSAHQALSSLRDDLMKMGGGWVLEVDIEGFFDALDHQQLRGFLDQRVRDGVIRRVVHKWLKAGVLEGGAVWRPKTGTPQGGVLSPLLANVYLHHVLDAWWEVEVQPRLRGRATLVRYADDVVIAFEREDDARRVMEVLPKRFERYGLTLHPKKTRLVRFERPRRSEGGSGGEPRPGSFDFLGFTHHWAKSRKGRWVVKQRTARDRLSRALRRVGQWCRANRHAPLASQRDALAAKLRGHYSYFGITGNYVPLVRFYRGTYKLWRKWLRRRSNAGRHSWAWFNALLERLPLPRPRAIHSVLRLSAKA
jgi:group II intron reverse transcriptase/maturase